MSPPAIGVGSAPSTAPNTKTLSCVALNTKLLLLSTKLNKSPLPFVALNSQLEPVNSFTPLTSFHVDEPYLKAVLSNSKLPVN